MGFRAQQYVKHLTGLEPAQRLILYEISAWCMDDTGSLQWTKEHLAATAGIAFRTFERHFARLTALKLVLWSRGGFCLIDFWEKQNGGGQIDRQIDRQNGGAYKEETRQIPSDSVLTNKTSDDDKKSSSSPTPPSEPQTVAEESGVLDPPEIDRLTVAVEKQYRLSRDVSRKVVLLGALRNQGKSRIRSPEYFRSIVAELLKQPLPRFYAEYLEHKLEELRGMAVAARAP